MTWRCPRCGEQLDDSFDACWRCGGQDPAASGVSTQEMDAAGESDPEFAELVIQEEEEEQTFSAEVDRYQRAAGWYPVETGASWPMVGNALHRLVVAYRLYRDRREHPSRAHPHLDRLWLHFFLSLGAFGVVLLGLVAPSSWQDLLLASPTIFGITYGSTLILAVVTGRWVVGRELRAAAEQAVLMRRPSGSEWGEG